MADIDKKSDILVGVDFGGTKILSGVFTPKLELVGTVKISTKAHRSVDAVIDRIARCVRDAIDECDLNLKQLKAVGVGAPGAVDSGEGVVINGPNIGWENVPLKKELEKRLEVPVFVDNDCNACTIGVHEVELGGQARDLVGVFLGTGIGAGLIFNGKMYSGYNRTAGEIGHMIIRAEGKSDKDNPAETFEELASRTAIFRRIKQAVKDGKKTLLTETLGEELDNLRSGDLRKAIRKGDKLVEGIVEQAAVYAGIGLANVINLLNPEVIVVGGGLIEALENTMFDLIEKNARKFALPGVAKGIKIIPSKLGDKAGIYGAGVIASRGIKSA
ncbi:MAG TPA: ROK family protein [Verrucomicrobiales bacterium]|nr:ROK family protein [Verrucomicrobiales bacterium]